MGHANFSPSYMKHEIYVKCEWKHQKHDDLMNYKFLCPIHSSITTKKMQTRNKVEQNMDFCGVMSCTNKPVHKGQKRNSLYSLQSYHYGN